VAVLSIKNPREGHDPGRTRNTIRTGHVTELCKRLAGQQLVLERSENLPGRVLQRLVIVTDVVGQRQTPARLRLHSTLLHIHTLQHFSNA